MAIKQSSQHWPAYLCRSFSHSCQKNLPLAVSDYDQTADLLKRSKYIILYYFDEISLIFFSFLFF